MTYSVCLANILSTGLIEIAVREPCVELEPDGHGLVQQRVTHFDIHQPIGVHLDDELNAIAVVGLIGGLDLDFHFLQGLAVVGAFPGMTVIKLHANGLGGGLDGREVFLGFKG